MQAAGQQRQHLVGRATNDIHSRRDTVNRIIERGPQEAERNLGDACPPPPPSLLTSVVNRIRDSAVAFDQLNDRLYQLGARTVGGFPCDPYKEPEPNNTSIDQISAALDYLSHQVNQLADNVNNLEKL